MQYITPALNGLVSDPVLGVPFVESVTGLEEVAVYPIKVVAAPFANRLTSVPVELLVSKLVSCLWPCIWSFSKLPTLGPVKPLLLAVKYDP